MFTQRTWWGKGFHIREDNHLAAIHVVTNGNRKDSWTVCITVTIKATADFDTSYLDVVTSSQNSLNTYNLYRESVDFKSDCYFSRSTVIITGVILKLINDIKPCKPNKTFVVLATKQNLVNLCEWFLLQGAYVYNQELMWFMHYKNYIVSIVHGRTVMWSLITSTIFMFADTHYWYIAFTVWFTS